jgi:hypothetical protein
MFAIVVSVFAICNFNTKNVTSHEGFGMNPSGSYKLERQTASGKEAWAKGDIYSVPGTYQGILNPRFANVDFGANIRYNMPSYENQGVPCEPLTFGSMVRENFNDSDSGGYPAPRCGKGGAQNSFHTGAPLMEGNYANGNYNQIVDQIPKYPNVSDIIPVGDMSTVNALGETVQPIVYDRFVFANRNSRLRSQGDMIRGDLPIVPCNTEWFRPSVTPHLDLQQGAMNVMGGIDNETAQSMADLIYNTSMSNTIGGVDMSTSKNTRVGQYMNTVQVSAFA